MFRTTDSARVLLTLIFVLQALVLFAIIGCSSKSNSNLGPDRRQPVPPKPATDRGVQVENPNDTLQSDNERLKEEVEQAKAAKNRAESRIQELLEWTGELQSDNERLKEEVEQAKAAKNRAESRIQELLEWTGELQSNNEGLKEEVEQAKAAKNRAELRIQELHERAGELQSNNERLKREVGQAKAAKNRAESRIQELRGDLNQAENQVAAARKQIEEAKAAKTKTEAENAKLKQQLALIPQAEILSVKHTYGRRQFSGKGIKIIGEFSVSNRKGHKVHVIALFYFADGRELRSPDQGKAFKKQVAVKQAFTPKYVKRLKAERFEIFMPFTDLHVSQAATLKYEVRIYDETTERFLEKTPYSKQFSYNPFAD